MGFFMEGVGDWVSDGFCGAFGGVSIAGTYRVCQAMERLLHSSMERRHVVCRQLFSKSSRGRGRSGTRVHSSSHQISGLSKTRKRQIRVNLWGVLMEGGVCQQVV